jgi:hypothetical protein
MTRMADAPTKDRARLSLIGHGAACTIAVAAFVCIAAKHVALTGKFGPMLPFHTTNSYLATAINSRAGSERLLEVFAVLPEKEPVAVIYRDDEEVDTFIAFAVVYFAWPRKVEAFPVRRENLTSQMQALADAPVSAVFFCGVEPPPGTAPLFRVGNGLSLSRRTAPQPQ